MAMRVGRRRVRDPESEFVAALGRRLRALRQGRELSQREVADSLDLSTTTLGALEDGRREPAAGTLLRLAIYYGVSSDLLLGRDER